MPDYDQLMRNLAYGVAHRSAQLTRWFGETFWSDPPMGQVGQNIVQFADEVESMAFNGFLPYVPPLPSNVTIVRVLHGTSEPAIGAKHYFPGDHDPVIAPLAAIQAYESQWPNTVWSPPHYDPRYLLWYVERTG